MDSPGYRQGRTGKAGAQVRGIDPIPSRGQLAGARGKLLGLRHERMWRSAAATVDRQCQWPHRVLSEVPEGTARTRRAPMARRARTADLREHLGRGLAAVGRTHE